ncbi:hypothetical protein G7046_g4231 [Stylonectria norvegica]|nr:hypothetical protein G7046_g4231 [Stylonectria norvegica]
MVKRTTFTNITPLPPSLTRQIVIAFLHDHLEMIDLNPLVKERHAISPPAHASPEEHRCVWYSLTDRVDYLPGGLVSGEVSYTCAFHDLPEGLQTHCYAPMGLDIRDRWSVGGSLPGEPKEPVELGLNAPQTGLYLREDVDLRCNVLMAGFVRKTIKKSHGSLVKRLAAKAELVSANNSRQDIGSNSTSHQRQQRADLQSWASSSWSTPGTSIRSETSLVTPPGLPPPSSGDQQQGIPGSGPLSNRQHAGQTLGPYGGRYPSGTLANQQNSGPAPQPPSDGTAAASSGAVYPGDGRPPDYTDISRMDPYQDGTSPGGRQAPEREDRWHRDPRMDKVRPTELE